MIDSRVLLISGRELDTMTQQPWLPDISALFCTVFHIDQWEDAWPIIIKLFN